MAISGDIAAQAVVVMAYPSIPKSVSASGNEPLAATR